MKKLGFGLMRLPLLRQNEAGNIDVEQVKQMVDVFLEKGFTYFDTAWMYCGFQSEHAAKAALVDRYPRDRFTLATKLNAGFFDSLEDRDRIFEEQRSKTGVEYFDYYLLHGVDAVNAAKFEAFHCFEWLKEKKEQGLVRHIGFSYHDGPGLLDELLTKHPETEFVQLQINYLDWESPWIQSRACYETAVRHGVPVIVMEPVKGGTLAKLPEQAEKLLKGYAPNRSLSSWAVRFAASLEGVMLVLSGMSSLDQMLDNLGYMEDFQPLGEEEKALVWKAAEIVNSQTAIPCTGCSYCTEGCPAHIAIPQYFSLYNEDMRERLEEKGWTVNFNNYSALTHSFGKAKDCTACGRCESMCPQHLPIRDLLRDVSRHYDR